MMILVLFKSRAGCDAPCFEQLKATHLKASPKQQALLDVLHQLIKTWPLTIGPWNVQCVRDQITEIQGQYKSFPKEKKIPNVL